MNETPEHHIHQTLEWLKAEDTSAGGGAVTVRVAHKIAFLFSKIGEQIVRAGNQADDAARIMIRLTRWIIALTIILGVIALAQVYVTIWPPHTSQIPAAPAIAAPR